MDSGMIGKIQKAKRYAQEKERIHFKSFTVTFDGSNNENTVTYDEGKWTCTCLYFQTREWCSHTKAMELILEQMVSEK